MLDLAYASVTEPEANRLLNACPYPAGLDPLDQPPGATEPWIGEIAAAILRASGETFVLETGGYLGHTTLRLAHALGKLGGGTLYVAEIDPMRAQAIHERLTCHAPTTVDFRVFSDDVQVVVRGLNDRSLGFVWLDDDHDAAHVEEETRLLLPKMKFGGIICYHDVFGSCDLKRVVRGFGGYALDLPRLGPAGGIGVLQV